MSFSTARKLQTLCEQKILGEKMTMLWSFLMRLQLIEGILKQREQLFSTCKLFI